MVVSICVDLKLIPVERVKFCGVKPFSLPMHGFNIYPLFYRLFIYFLLFLSLISPELYVLNCLMITQHPELVFQEEIPNWYEIQFLR